MKDGLIAHTDVKASGNVLGVAVFPRGVFYVSSDIAHEPDSISTTRQDMDRPSRLQRFRYSTPFRDGLDGVQCLANKPEELGQAFELSTETLGPEILDMDCKRVSELAYGLETLRKRGGNDDE